MTVTIELALGRAIRRRREELGTSQAALAEMAGVSADHLGKIERGSADPLISTLDRIGRALDLTYAELALLIAHEFLNG